MGTIETAEVQPTQPWPVPDNIKEGVKFDDGKAPLHLLDTDALLDVANVFAFGAKKYHEHNWRNGIRATRLLNSAGRHLLELQAGRDTDPESELNHAAHAIAGLMMFIATMRDKPDFDDRFKVGA